MSHFSVKPFEGDDTQLALLASLESLTPGTGQFILKLTSTTLGLGSGITGSGTANQITYFTSSNAIASSPSIDVLSKLLKDSVLNTTVDWENEELNESFGLITRSSLNWKSRKAYSSAGVNTFDYEIPAFPVFTSNGFLKTSGGNGTLSVDTTAYLSGVTTDTTLTGAGTGGSPLAINLGKSNIWTGVVTLSPAIRTSGSASYFKINAPADTGITASTESIGVNIVGATRTWADGTVAVQREYLFQAPTYNKTTTAATFTQSGTVVITGAPISGTGVTQTNPYALWIQSGNMHIGDQLGGSPYAPIGENGIEVAYSNDTAGGVATTVTNISSGTHAYGGFGLVNDLGNGSSYTHFAGMFYTGNGYNDASYGAIFNVPNQLQIYGTDGPTIIGTQATGAAGYMNVVIGGSALANEVARFTTTGMGIGTTTVTSKLNVNATNLGTTQTLVSGITIGTNTAATLNNQQIGGALTLSSNGFATGSSTSRNTSFVLFTVPSQGNANPTANLVIQSSLNGGALSGNLLTISLAGVVSTGSSFSVGGSGSLNSTGNVAIANTVNGVTADIGSGSTASGSTVAITIGNGGASGSIKTIIIGSSTAGVTSTTTMNGSITNTGNLKLAAGTTTVSPLTFQSGTNLTTAAAGNMEFDGTQLYFSPSTTRHALIQDNGSRLTSGTIPVATTSGFLIDSSFTTTNLVSNNFSPTSTNVTNITSSTPNNATYQRMGNIVTVFGSITVTNTLAVASEVDVSLPVASNLGAASDLNGLATMDSTASVNIYIKGDATNDRASIFFTSAGIGQTSTIYYSYQYKVI